MSDKITGVCLDIPTLIKEAKHRELVKKANEAALQAFPDTHHWTSPLARETDLARAGYIKAYLEFHNERK